MFVCLSEKTRGYSSGVFKDKYKSSFDMVWEECMIKNLFERDFEMLT